MKSYLREIYRVLTPGGYFRFQVHDPSNPEAGRFDEEGSNEKQYGFHGNVYTPGELRDLLTEHGFSIITLVHTSPWIWATVTKGAEGQGK